MTIREEAIEAMAESVIDELRGRSGLRQTLDSFDDDILEEIAAAIGEAALAALLPILSSHRLKCVGRGIGDKVKRINGSANWPAMHDAAECELAGATAPKTPPSPTLRKETT